MLLFMELMHLFPDKERRAGQTPNISLNVTFTAGIDGMLNGTSPSLFDTELGAGVNSGRTIAVGWFTREDGR